VSIIRLSGTGAGAAAASLLAGEKLPAPARLARRVLSDPDSGRPLDEAMVVHFPGPDSYTGEDVVELHLHGSPLLVARVLELLARQGVRPARPGEFTLRAFLSHRKDLAQAEAVQDLVAAEGTAALEAAAAQLVGGISRAVEALREQLLELVATLEADLDFPDDVDALPVNAVVLSLSSIAGEIKALADTWPTGRVWKEGFRVVLAGSPNVGKSALFNALLGEDRAIVTPEPGTTRDFLAELLPGLPVPVRLVDTAGMRETRGLAEGAGVRRSREQVETADLVLLVVDSSRPWNDEDRSIEAATRGQTRLVVWTKCDLAEEATLAGMAPAGELRVSALRGDGVAALRQRLAEIARTAAPAAAGGMVLTSARQQAALLRAHARLVEARTGAETLPRDILTSLVREALHAVNEVVGRGAVTEEVLDAIFSRFCIGK
jgi:tRNA modification GTPase